MTRWCHDFILAVCLITTSLVITAAAIFLFVLTVGVGTYLAMNVLLFLFS